jgi:hypothetical protein
MGNDDLLRFLHAIDAGLAGHAAGGEIVELHLLGRSALILGYGLEVQTVDIDIVYVHGSRMQEIAVQDFGRGTSAAGQYGFYLEAVPPGLPPLPVGYQARCIDVEGPWMVIRPKRPEANDLAVTKLKRFHARDRQDLRFLCDHGLVDAATLRERLDAAHLFTEPGDEGREKAYANLEIMIDYLEGQRRVF